jgi:hypothetical protein
MEKVSDNFHFPSRQTIEQHLAEHPETRDLTDKTRQAIANAFADKVLAGHRIHSTMLHVTLFGSIPSADTACQRDPAYSHYIIPPLPQNCGVDGLHRRLFLALIACANQHVPSKNN